MMALAVVFAVWSPDPELTPGAIDPAVTQDTIAQTICVVGYTKTVRNVTQATKRALVKSYRAKHPDWPVGPYEIDHLISIEIGGSNEVTNLFPQPLDEARKKDVIENRLHRSVCRHQTTLADAQAKILQWDR